MEYLIPTIKSFSEILSGLSGYTYFEVFSSLDRGLTTVFLLIVSVLMLENKRSHL